MSEEQPAATHTNDSPAPPPSLDQVWRNLKRQGLVKGPRPRREHRLNPDTVKPIQYHGSNEDILRDLGRRP